ncbi:metal-dependent CAAX amino terminal membrane protease [Streptococcus pneumoniae]|nr:metal-dependent CAAX amino terminal membrane protease [Streptococcus pneumoniae]
MKEKNMWKELLNRAGWLLVFLLATILYQIPIGVTAILTLNEVPLLQSGLIVAGISIVVLVLFIFGARKTQLASFNFSFFRAKDLARLGLSYLVIICSNILGSILLQLCLLRFVRKSCVGELFLKRFSEARRTWDL